MRKKSTIITVIITSLALLSLGVWAFVAFVWPGDSDGLISFPSPKNRSLRRVDLPHNSPQAIRDELLDDTLVRIIGKAAGVSDECLDAMRRKEDETWRDQNPKFKDIFARPWDWFDWPHEHWNEGYTLRRALENYVKARYEGHTKEFMLSALTNMTSTAEIEDPGIRGIVEVYPWIPASSLKKVDSGTNERTRTNGVYNSKGEIDEIKRIIELKGWAVYTLVDGDIVWRYFVEFNAGDGSAYTGADNGNKGLGGYRGYIYSTKYDAKEDNEKYAEIFRKVEKEVRLKMKLMGRTGLGSCHVYWAYKKKSLAKKGIHWRSPSELNPGTIYD